MNSFVAVTFFVISFANSTPKNHGERHISPPTNHYVFENNLCNYPCIDPWTFKEFYVNKSYVPCDENRPPVYLEKNNGKTYAVINATAKKTTSFNCCVRNVYRAQQIGIPDNNIVESRCVHFDSEGKLELNNDVVKISCHTINSVTNNVDVFYENVYGIYPSFNVKNKSLKERSDANAFSVLLLVLDSVSRQNFVRLLPQTYEFLIHKDWISFQAYNAIGEDALENALALLTGHTSFSAVAKFGNPKEKFYDEVEFVWYDFQKLGYATAYAEDYATVNVFNKESKGFFKSPTDYYFRHYVLAAERLNTTYLDNMPYCTGPENSGERILNLAHDFASTFQSHPYFGLFAVNTFAREDLNSLGRMDRKLSAFLERLEPLLNDTLVFFLSGHGYRKPDVTYTALGRFESRMPFLHARLPEAFRTRFADEADNLRENAGRLTSAFDVYATLEDLVAIASDQAAKTPSACPECESLLRKVPSARSCGEAGIAEEWCNCFRNVSGYTEVGRVVERSAGHRGYLCIRGVWTLVLGLKLINF